MSSETPATPLDPPPVYRVRIGEMPETDRPRERLQRLNERVQIGGEAPAVVARDYLRVAGFLP